MIEYHIDTPRNVAITRAMGRVNVAEVTAHLVRLMRDPAFKPELNALIVVGKISTVPGPVGVGALTPLVRAWSKRRAGVKWAFVLPNRETRNFVESAIEQARLTAVTTRCFLSEEAALTWLAPVPTPEVSSVGAMQRPIQATA
jgi:hypothetical protein